MRQILITFRKKPKKVFLMDGFGALLSAFFLLFILIPFQEYVGLSTKILFILSAIAFFLFLYSYSCYKLVQQNFKPYIKLLIALNSLYMLFSIAVIIYHFNQLTFLGIFYFTIEIFLILCILYIEIITFLYLKKPRL